jgi:transcriptional regulator with XRE-family HTH domain
MARTKRETPHPIDRAIGARISSLRFALGTTQSDLGRGLGLTFQQIQKYEKGTNRVSGSKLWEAARVLGVDVRELFPPAEASALEVEALADVGCDRSAHELLRHFQAMTPDARRSVLSIARAIASTSALRGAMADERQSDVPAMDVGQVAAA